MRTAQNQLESAYSTEASIYPACGGPITIDQAPLTPGLCFYQLCCGTGGTLLIQGIDGGYIYYPLVAAGQIVVAVGVKVVSSATWQGQSLSTSASNIWWYGGK